ERHAEIEDVAGLFVDHLLRQAEAWHLCAHEAARLRVGLEHGDVITQRRKIAGHGQRGRAGADAGHAESVLLRCRRRHARAHVTLEIRGHALEPADRHRLGLAGVVLLHPPAPARRFTGAVAGAPEDAGKDVALPVHHVGVGVTAGRDQADVLGDRRVRRAGPLAVDDLVEDVGVADVGRLQASLPQAAGLKAVAGWSLAYEKPGTGTGNRELSVQGIRTPWCFAAGEREAATSPW